VDKSSSFAHRRKNQPSSKQTVTWKLAGAGKGIGLDLQRSTKNTTSSALHDDDLIVALVVCLYTYIFYMAGTGLFSAAWLP